MLWRSASGVSGETDARLFLHGLGFPGQRCLSRPQGRSFEQTRIGRHQVARLQQQHVARHNLGCGHHCGMTATHHPGPGAARRASAATARSARYSWTEANHRVQYHNGQDGQAIDQLTKRHRDQRGPDQHPDHQAAELPRQDRQRGDGLALTQRVGSPLLQACAASGGVSPCGHPCGAVQRVWVWLVMPARACRHEPLGCTPVITALVV